jgi:hypothetical protein
LHPLIWWPPQIEFELDNAEVWNTIVFRGLHGK